MIVWYCTIFPPKRRSFWAITPRYPKVLILLHVKFFGPFVGALLHIWWPRMVLGKSFDPRNSWPPAKSSRKPTSRPLLTLCWIGGTSFTTILSLQHHLHPAVGPLDTFTSGRTIHYQPQNYLQPSSTLLPSKKTGLRIQLWTQKSTYWGQYNLCYQCYDVSGNRVPNIHMVGHHAVPMESWKAPKNNKNMNNIVHEEGKVNERHVVSLVPWNNEKMNAWHPSFIWIHRFLYIQDKFPWKMDVKHCPHLVQMCWKRPKTGEKI